jgi:hypothetical protein
MSMMPIWFPKWKNMEFKNRVFGLPFSITWKKWVARYNLDFSWFCRLLVYIYIPIVPLYYLI